MINSALKYCDGRRFKKKNQCCYFIFCYFDFKRNISRVTVPFLLKFTPKMSRKKYLKLFPNFPQTLLLNSERSYEVVEVKPCLRTH